MNRRLTALVLFLLVFSTQAFGWNTLANSINIYCQQVDKNLHCKYRAVDDTLISSINARSNKLELKISASHSYPTASDQTAILFLVDTSDPARQHVIEKNKTQLKEILATLKPYQKAGLASFDKSLTILSSIGTSSFLLTKSVDTLKASGKTTELYRNVLKAMARLNSFEAQRKVIVLLSDGQAEDKAYFHSDVIKMARKSDIVINSIGFPRSISLSVALQTLRRLSEETGGRYIETDTSYDLPKSDINQLFNNIDNGGEFSVSLDELFNADDEINFITLSFTTQSAIRHIQVPVKIKPTKVQVATPPLETTINNEISSNNAAPKSEPIRIITKHVSPQPVNLWLWYGIPASFIIIIIFILITLYLLWRKPTQQIISYENEYRPFAYLITNDENQTRYPITRTIFRIGRSKDNEMDLNDASVSRRHAEIHRNNDGTFEIVDMNSMNGVYINNEKVGKAELHEGDLVEIGDFFLRFTQLAPEHSLEEPTVMQKTRAPRLD